MLLQWLTRRSGIKNVFGDLRQSGFALPRVLFPSQPVFAPPPIHVAAVLRVHAVRVVPVREMCSGMRVLVNSTRLDSRLPTPRPAPDVLLDTAHRDRVP